jgi:predicted O-methyltransferase YrrM
MTLRKIAHRLSREYRDSMLKTIRQAIARLAGRGGPDADQAEHQPPADIQPTAGPIAVHPLTDIPCPDVNLRQAANPIAEIFASPVFARTQQFFGDSPALGRSLVSGTSQAVIHAIIRNLRPDHVFEIGTYKGGTTEAMSRALHANGSGTMHTVGPFDSDHFLPVLDAWPNELQQRVRFYPEASMDFYMRMEREKIRPGLVFVDGNHDYEFALFDIQCAARSIMPGGFIVVDNVSQAGPYYAAVDFLRENPAWLDCSFRPDRGLDPAKAFDPNRSGIPESDFIVLRAPASHLVGVRPRTFGEILVPLPRVNGIELSLAAPQRGTLHVQCILRGFSARGHAEVTGRVSVDVDGTSTTVAAMFETPIIVENEFDHYRAEPWLIWMGARSLELNAEPGIL